MSILNIFKKTKYNYWISEEIKLCKNNGYNIEQYITPTMHPLHVKQIRQALFDDFPNDYIKKISNMEFDEKEIENTRQEMFLNVDLKYFLENFKPKIIKNANNIHPLDAIKGAILGDIIGCKFEFVEHEKITDLKFDGRFSDDTVLTIATKDAIVNYDKNDKNKYLNSYKKYYQKYPSAGYGGGFISWCLDEQSKPYGSFGNGSAMRISAIPTYYDDIEDVITQTYFSAIISHNHLEGIKGAIVTSVVIWMAKNHYTKDEIKEYLYSHYDYTLEQIQNRTISNTQFYLKKIEQNKFNSQISITCQFAVPYAIYCFLNSESFEECMLKVLEHFCDADTICTIAGSVAAMFYSFDEKYEVILKEKLTEYLYEKLNK